MSFSCYLMALGTWTSAGHGNSVRKRADHSSPALWGFLKNPQVCGASLDLTSCLECLFSPHGLLQEFWFCRVSSVTRPGRHAPKSAFAPGHCPCSERFLQTLGGGPCLLVTLAGGQPQEDRKSPYGAYAGSLMPCPSWDLKRVFLLSASGSPGHGHFSFTASGNHRPLGISLQPRTQHIHGERLTSP